MDMLLLLILLLCYNNIVYFYQDDHYGKKLIPLITNLQRFKLHYYLYLYIDSYKTVFDDKIKNI